MAAPLQVFGPFDDVNGTFKMALRRGNIVLHVTRIHRTEIDNFDAEAAWAKAATVPARIRK